MFLGTFSPHKGPDIAIEVAKSAGIPILLAGERREEFEGFYHEKVALNEDGKNVIIKGELTFVEKTELLMNAKALLVPVRWQEAFGLVLIEAMACGTPVIGFRKGALPEIIENGKTGFVVESALEMKKAVLKVEEIDRSYCRKVADEKFSIKRMVDDYERLYREVISGEI